MENAAFLPRDRSRSFIDWLGSVEHTYTDSILGEILGFCPRTRDQHVIIYCKIQREIQKSNAKSRNPTWNPEIQLEIHLKSGNPARNPEILTKSRASKRAWSAPRCSGIPQGNPRGPTRRRVGVRDFEIQWISRFRFRFQDFSLDFWISSGFQDFSLDFRISSGFQVGFLDFKLDFWISR